MAELPPVDQVAALLSGFQVSQAIYVAAKLSIADKLEEGPMSVAQLAARCHARPEALSRLLRTLAAVGIFSCDPVNPEEVYSNTPRSEVLSSTAESSVRTLAITSMEALYMPFTKLLDVVTGNGTKSGAELYYGKSMVEWLSENPEQHYIFADAMANRADQRWPAIMTLNSAIGDKADALIIDIGGGNGGILAALLERRPRAYGIVYDSPQLLEESTEIIREAHLKDRMTARSGDILTAVPKGGDVYLLVYILQDYDDQSCVRILKNIRRSMKDDATLAILEGVVPLGNKLHMTKLTDLAKLGLMNGQDRSARHLRRLLAESGFNLRRVQTTCSPLSWLYAEPDTSSTKMNMPTPEEEWCIKLDDRRASA